MRLCIAHWPDQQGPTMCSSGRRAGHPFLGSTVIALFTSKLPSAVARSLRGPRTFIPESLLRAIILCMNALRATPPWVLPVAIVLAGIIISGALYYVRVREHVTKEAGDVSVVRPVTPSDHLIGNPTAPVMVVEYGDIDSEYTKKFNAIMEQLMTEYAPGGQVAWVFRHFPIIALHPNSAAHASAAECVAALGGSERFWGFLDAIAANAPGTNQFDPRDYGTILPGLGVQSDAFTQCLSKGTYEQKVQDDYTNAILSGATGSPYIVLVVKGQRSVPISGALPYQSMKQVLDESLKKASN